MENEICMDILSVSVIFFDSGKEDVSFQKRILASPHCLKTLNVLLSIFDDFGHILFMVIAQNNRQNIVQIG